MKKISIKYIRDFLRHIGLIQYFLNIFTFYGLKGPLDNNGYECPASCPMNCPMVKDGMINCPGGDDGNGCMMPDYCMSSEGNI